MLCNTVTDLPARTLLIFQLAYENYGLNLPKLDFWLVVA